MYHIIVEWSEAYNRYTGDTDSQAKSPLEDVSIILWKQTLPRKKARGRILTDLGFMTPTRDIAVQDV